MDLAGLRTFAAVVDAGSLTRAARLTRQSLASVSRQLRALEDEVGVTLARRTTRRLEITAEGRDLHERALRILREAEAALAVGRAGRLRGAMVVSLPVTLGLALIVPRLGPLLRRHSGLQLEVRLEDRLNDLVLEGIDLVVRAGVAPPDSPDLVATPLRRFERILVAASGALSGRAAPREPGGLARLDGLVQASTSGVVDRWRLQRGEEERVVQVPVRLVSTAPLVLLEAARAGVGVALLPDWLVEEDLRAGRLVRLLPGWASRPVTAWAVYRRALRGSPAVRAFLEAVAEEDAALPALPG
jgi:DNA-binding transcriptional LysR family regulator